MHPSAPHHYKQGTALAESDRRQRETNCCQAAAVGVTVVSVPGISD